MVKAVVSSWSRLRRRNPSTGGQRGFNRQTTSDLDESRFRHETSRSRRRLRPDAGRTRREGRGLGQYRAPADRGGGDAGPARRPCPPSCAIARAPSPTIGELSREPDQLEGRQASRTIANATRRISSIWTTMVMMMNADKGMSIDALPRAEVRVRRGPAGGGDQRSMTPDTCPMPSWTAGSRWCAIWPAVRVLSMPMERARDRSGPGVPGTCRGPGAPSRGPDPARHRGAVPLCRGRVAATSHLSIHYNGWGNLSEPRGLHQLAPDPQPCSRAAFTSGGSTQAGGRSRRRMPAPVNRAGFQT